MRSDHAAGGSWGGYPRVRHHRIDRPEWRDQIERLDALDRPVLAYGRGRSYGDACLNEHGILLFTEHLNRFIHFDRETGILRCEAGVTLEEILEMAVPARWFLPVLPGTKFVTVGGAVANDIHGKNHHREGSFGLHVRRIGLLRSDGTTLECSQREDRDLFGATIGGLGLTGLMLWVEIQLKRIPGPFLQVERRAFRHIDEYLDITPQSDANWQYTVAWIDCLTRGRALGKGILFQANHVESPSHLRRRAARAGSQRNRTIAPAILPNRYAVGLFNHVYRTAQRVRPSRSVSHYEPFFFPLDGLSRWNRPLGALGLVQFQCVIPENMARETLPLVLTMTRRRQVPLLGVVKRFGEQSSPGWLSFPRPGISLALDFALQSPTTLTLVRSLEGIVAQAGGAMYPAKDVCMSGERFRQYFPRHREFARLKDPHFSSSLWRRVCH